MDLISGCGYLGRKLALAPNLQQIPVGLVHTRESAQSLRKLGIEPLLIDLDSGAAIALPEALNRIFYLAPPPKTGITDSRLKHFLAALAAHPPERIVYISTTGVYGDCQGQWVAESHPVNPVAARALRRRDAELQLQAFSRTHGSDIVILRVAGIYGPGKLPLQRLARQQPMVAVEDAPWTNRIHVDDLVSICIAAMQKPLTSTIYNVSDGSPEKMTHYFNQVAIRAGLPQPPVISSTEARSQLSAGMQSYIRESRKIDNRKMIAELNITLAYPTLATGLENCDL